MLQKKIRWLEAPVSEGNGKTEDIQLLIESEKRLRQPRIVVFSVCKH